MVRRWASSAKVLNTYWCGVEEGPPRLALYYYSDGSRLDRRGRLAPSVERIIGIGGHAPLFCGGTYRYVMVRNGNRYLVTRGSPMQALDDFGYSSHHSLVCIPLVDIPLVDIPLVCRLVVHQTGR